ncbi:MAG: YfiR family protein, partial [Gemmatimonadota bacterium]
ACVLACALPLAAAGGLAAQASRAPESQVKAVFLFNFAQFVEWPPEAFAGPDTPLVIGVLGADPFEGFLDRTVLGEELRGRPFQVRRYRSADEITTCHILFIGARDGERVEQILRRLATRPILTVGDEDRFTERGGMIRFVTDQNRIRLRINVEAAQAAGLTISSKLLRLAEIVTPQGR